MDELPHFARGRARPLPQEARAALRDARQHYTPSAERLAQLQERIAHAIAVGAVPSVPEHELTPPRYQGPNMPGGALERYRWLAFVGLGIMLLAFVGTNYVRRAAAPTPRPAASVHEAASTSSAPSPSFEQKLGVVPPQGSTSSVPRETASGTVPDELGPARSLARARVAPSVAHPVFARAPEDALRQARFGSRGSRRKAGRTPAVTEDPFGPEFDAPAEVPSEDPASERSAGPTDLRSRAGGGAATRDRLAEEVQLIAEARAAMDAGKALQADQLLEMHRRNFPAGQLGSERTALETKARCLAHDAAGARRLFGELLLLSPRSSLRRSVERACGALVSAP